MPGVPREMKPMLAEHVVPFLRERFGARDAIYTRVLHTIDIGESEIDHRIDELFRTSENPKIAVLAHDFRADVKIMAKAASPSGRRSDDRAAAATRSSVALRVMSSVAIETRPRARSTSCYNAAG